MSDGHREIWARFRRESLTLGILWCLMGGGLLALGVLLATGFFGEDNGMVGVFLVPFSLLWIGAAVLTIRRVALGIYAGTVCSYCSLLGLFVSLNVCALLTLLAAILQAHRLLSWHRQLLAAGLTPQSRL